MCVHHWFLETPVGLTTHGTCRGCGAEKDFYAKPWEFGEGYSTPEYARALREWRRRERLSTAPWQIGYLGEEYER
jgi:hypothetical protein